MQNVRSLAPSMPVKDRLSMKLALLFVGSFLAVFVVLMAWTMIASIGDRREAAADTGVAAPVIVIDPKIQSDLAKAMAFDAIPATTEVQNPFVDRANLAGNAVVATGGPTAVKAGTSSSANSGANAAAPGTSSQVVGSHIEPSMGSESYSPRSRYDDWVERQKRGEFVGPESEVLWVEDLVPVGFASGGDRGPEVMLFSVALCRTFSLPAGTRFADGWLYGFDQKEVVFTFQNGVRRKSYSTADACRPDVSSQAANASER